MINSYYKVDIPMQSAHTPIQNMTLNRRSLCGKRGHFCKIANSAKGGQPAVEASHDISVNVV